MDKNEPLRITPGEAKVGPLDKFHGREFRTIRVPMPPPISNMAEDVAWVFHDEDATLYADAHNTYNRTQVLPSVMAEQLEEARGLLQQWINQRDGVRVTVPETMTREFLNRTTPNTPTQDGQDH